MANYRRIAARAAGRRLLPGEEVHHKDRNPYNNHPDNLQIMLRRDHKRLHMLENRRRARWETRKLLNRMQADWDSADYILLSQLQGLDLSGLT